MITITMPRKRSMESTRLPDGSAAISFSPNHPQITQRPFAICVICGWFVLCWPTLQFDWLCGYDLCERPQRLQRLFTQRRIYLDDGHRFTTAFAAPEMKPTYIHASLAQDRADAANHARNIVIARHEHVALRCRLEMKAVDLGDTAFAALLPIAKKRPRQTLF